MTKILLSKFFAVAVFCGLLTTTTFALEVPAEWNFKKITTPHFDVIFDARQQALGEEYARQAEKAFSILSPVFTATPERTLLIINDKTDATNGYATRVPYPHIMIYPVLPGPYESLSESGDWSLELISHEYTHILTFEPATGIFKALRGVFGSVLAPNLLLPNWWKEGLAVQVESSLGTQGGRLKSIYQDATIRAMAMNGTLTANTIDKANEFIPTWPEGMRSYLFGSLFWSQAVQDVGFEGANRLNLEHSGRVPYLVNQPAENILNATYEEEYEKALAETQRRALEQIEVLKKVPFSNLQALPMEAKYSSAPAISRDGKYLALITVDYKSDRVMEIFIRDPETKTMTKKLKVEIKSEEDPLAPTTKKDGPPSGSIQKMAWFNHSPTLVFDQLHYVNRIERYSDISMYDLKTLKTKRLTQGLRAREPAVSPDDSKIAFVKLDSGQTRLGIFNVATETHEILYTPNTGERISAPVFINNNVILFALRDSQGNEQLRHFSLQTKKATPILTQFAQARFPIVTKMGVIFTSSQNGVHNLYLASRDLKSARPITHVPTMVTLSTFDPINDELYTTTMTADGPRVQRIEKASWEKTPATLPKIEPLFADRFTKLLTTPATATAAAKVSDSETKAGAPTSESKADTESNPSLSKNTSATEMKSASTSATETTTPNPSQTPSSTGNASATSATETVPASGPSTSSYPITDYEAGPYLWPRYWIPFIWTSPEGGIVFQALTSGFDPLQKHAYSAMVGWDTYARSADWSFSYLNNVTSLPIQFVGAQSHSYLVTPDNPTEDSLASLSVLPEIWGFSEKMSLELGWRYLGRKINRTEVKRTGPYGNLVYRNITQGGEQFTPQTGYGAYLSAANYIAGDELTSHSQFQLGGVYYFSQFLPKLHAIMLRASALYTPESLSSIYGTQSESTDYTGVDLSAKFLARGYSSGQFIGKNMYNASLEYRFPVKDFYFGNGTTALFWRRLTGAVVADGIATDGSVYNVINGWNAVKANKIFWSYGLEAHIETTIGYEFPITAVLGLYKGADQQYAPDPTLGLALQFSGF